MALTDDEGYYCFGYANKSVKNEFKSYFMNFSTLAAAIDSLIFFGDNLYSRNTFMGNDVKYKLRAKASPQDDPVKVNEALLRWYSFVEKSNYKSMGCVIEKVFMVEKENYRKFKLHKLLDAGISYNRGIIDNGGSIQTNAKLSNLNNDGNATEVKNSDPLLLQSPKDENHSLTKLSERFQNFGSDGLAEYESGPCTEGGKKPALDSNLKNDTVEKCTKNSNDEAVLNIDKDVPADHSGNFAENKYKPEISKDPRHALVLTYSTEMFDDSQIKLINQQLESINLENDVQVSEINEPPIDSANEHFLKELTVPSGTETDELEMRGSSKNIDACEDGDSWGTTVEITSDCDLSGDYERDDN